jgi:hypothetical protein
MPTNPASRGLGHSIRRREKEVLDALGIHVDFAIVVSRKPLDKFRNDTLSSVPPVKEGGNDDKSHLIASSRRPQFG